MRRALTEPEKRLWSRLSRAQLGGYKYRRQAVVGTFIVDFLCPQRALAIEVDGDTHIDPAADARRDAVIARHGIRVIHFANSEVIENLDGVLDTILNELQAKPMRWATPHPNPSPEGQGLSPTK